MSCCCQDPYAYNEDDPEPDHQAQEHSQRQQQLQQQQGMELPADRNQTSSSGFGGDAVEDEAWQGGAGGIPALTHGPDDAMPRQQQQPPQHNQYQQGAQSHDPSARQGMQTGHRWAPQGAGPVGGTFQAQGPVYSGDAQQGAGSQPAGHAGESATDRRAMSNPAWGEPYPREQHVIHPQQPRQQHAGAGIGSDGREGWQAGQEQPRWQQGQRSQPASDTQSQPGPMGPPPEPPHGTRSAEALMPPPPPRRPAAQAAAPQAPQAAEPQRRQDASRQQQPAPPQAPPPAPFAPFRVPMLRGQRPDSGIAGGSHGLARPPVNLLALAAAGPAAGCGGGGSGAAHSGGGSGRGNGGGPPSSTSTSSTAEAIRRALSKAEQAQARNRARQHDIVENEEVRKGGGQCAREAFAALREACWIGLWGNLVCCILGQLCCLPPGNDLRACSATQDGWTLEQVQALQVWGRVAACPLCVMALALPPSFEFVTLFGPAVPRRGRYQACFASTTLRDIWNA